MVVDARVRLVRRRDPLQRRLGAALDVQARVHRPLVIVQFADFVLKNFRCLAVSRTSVGGAGVK